MAIRTREEIIASISKRIGDDTSDEALALLDDIKDTFDDYDTRTADGTNWKNKYEENDAEWRKRYKDAFMNKPIEEDFELERKDEPKVLSFDKLFKEGL